MSNFLDIDPDDPNFKRFVDAVIMPLAKVYSREQMRMFADQEVAPPIAAFSALLTAAILNSSAPSAGPDRETVLAAFADLYDVASSLRSKQLSDRDTRSQSCSICEGECACDPGELCAECPSVTKSPSVEVTNDFPPCTGCGAEPGELHKDDCPVRAQLASLHKALH